MNPQDDLAFEFRRHRAGIDLTEHQQAELQRLIKVLRFGSAFQINFVEISDFALRDRLIARIDEALAVGRVCIDLTTAQIADVTALEKTLVQNDANEISLIHIINADGWLDAERLQHLNLRREALAHSLHCKLVFWLPPALVERVARHAQDLYSWRTGVFDLEGEDIGSTIEFPISDNSEKTPASRQANLIERTNRIATLKQWLNQTENEDLRQPMLSELASHLIEMGELENAHDIYTRQAAFFNEYGMLDKEMDAQEGIAEILHHRGHYDQELKIRRDVQLPTYQKLGDMNAVAITYGSIAVILAAQGKHIEALNIISEKQLPHLQNLGDEQKEGLALLTMSGILQLRKEYEKALDISQNKALPIFERLGDESSQAIVYQTIASVLSRLEKYDDALVILKDKLLPLLHKLGDVRSVALTQQRIAEILKNQKLYAEAIGVMQSTLPVFRELGETHLEADAQCAIANLLALQGKLDAALELYLNAATVFRQLGRAPNETNTLDCIADIYDTQGKYQKANEIRLEQVLPAYEKMQNLMAVAMTKAYVAINLVRLDQRTAALEILTESLQDFRKIGNENFVRRITELLDKLKADFVTPEGR